MSLTAELNPQATSPIEAKPRIVRLLTLGESHVGKSSLLCRYATDEGFHPAYMPTIGIDFRAKTVEVNGQTVKVHVWDSAGQVRFRAITSNYVRGTQGIVLVYDVTDAHSFEAIHRFVENVRHTTDYPVEGVLVANKCDDAAERVITEAQGRELALKYDLVYYETSAKDSNSEDVVRVFDDLVRRVIEAEAAVVSEKLTVSTVVSPS